MSGAAVELKNSRCYGGWIQVMLGYLMFFSALWCCHMAVVHVASVELYMDLCTSALILKYDLLTDWATSQEVI